MTVTSRQIAGQVLIVLLGVAPFVAVLVMAWRDRALPVVVRAMLATFVYSALVVFAFWLRYGE